MTEPKAADPTNQRLIELRKVYNLTRPRVAQHCGVSLSAVDRWFYNPGGKWYRKAPERAVSLLEFALGIRKPEKKKRTASA